MGGDNPLSAGGYPPVPADTRQRVRIRVRMPFSPQNPGGYPGIPRDTRCQPRPREPMPPGGIPPGELVSGTQTSSRGRGSSRRGGTQTSSSEGIPSDELVHFIQDLKLADLPPQQKNKDVGGIRYGDNLQ
ncbi:hypothetical protein PGTUg99_036155 [Puccinia graminis f. sp. tritici]|uniref:Uncharacterized protein n=1 Tax=Puccinia graminis f. sp. tritici TaxID=56615 RepID=A0A5B0LUQ4_PUCGR|nr:hypothetical protein PGTUg99_036155 [Puccinia graminis f. sp. tritici]